MTTSPLTLKMQITYQQTLYTTSSSQYALTQGLGYVSKIEDGIHVKLKVTPRSVVEKTTPMLQIKKEAKYITKF